MAQLVSSVEKRLADCQVSFCGDAHDQECLYAKKNVLHWIQEVREDENVELVCNCFGIIHENEAKEHDVTASKSN